MDYDYESIKDKVINNLKHVFDPEIPVNIYDLGLIYSIGFVLEDKTFICKIDMTLTSPACPVADSLLEEVSYASKAVDVIDEAYVNLTFDPPWDKSKISQEGIEILMMHGTSI